MTNSTTMCAQVRKEQNRAWTRPNKGEWKKIEREIRYNIKSFVKGMTVKDITKAKEVLEKNGSKYNSLFDLLTFSSGLKYITMRKQAHWEANITDKMNEYAEEYFNNKIATQKRFS